jgi:hypothetical protein
MLERLHSFAGKRINVHVSVIVGPDTTMPTVDLLGLLAYGYPQGVTSNGIEEGVLFALDSEDEPRSHRSFSLWRSDLLSGREFADGVAWRVGPLMVTVQPDEAR